MNGGLEAFSLPTGGGNAAEPVVAAWNVVTEGGEAEAHVEVNDVNCAVQ